MSRLHLLTHFPFETSTCDIFFQRLQAKVLKLVDISYGGENGFNQAIELSAEVLSNVKFIQEKKLIGELSPQWSHLSVSSTKAKFLWFFVFSLSCLSHIRSVL